MHDSPPPYPGINPTYPAQPNGFSGHQQPHMGFASSPAAPPPYQGQAGFQAAGASYPQAPGSSYPTLPPNGFNNFQGPSAPSSKSR